MRLGDLQYHMPVCSEMTAEQDGLATDDKPAEIRNKTGRESGALGDTPAESMGAKGVQD
jgi:hypothetical protein